VKGRISEAAFKGEDKPSDRTGGREADARSREEPKGWRLWWPSNRKEDGPPGPHPGLGTMDKRTGYGLRDTNANDDDITRGVFWTM
jgi:hypothetical protein